MTSRGTRKVTRRRRAARATRLIVAVASLAEARAALEQGRAAGVGVTLFSPPGAAAYLGVGFFWALVEAARADVPGVEVEAVMDCGDDPGWALAALRTGFKAVVLGGHPGRAGVSPPSRRRSARACCYSGRARLQRRRCRSNHRAAPAPSRRHSPTSDRQ